jgi:MYXO-CTERM domain-containing protein
MIDAMQPTTRRLLLGVPALMTLTLASREARAVTLSVGPGRMYATPSAAAAAARDGDTVEIAAGTYRDIAIWRAHNLTIRGVGGAAHLDAAGLTIPNGKAIWVIQGRGYTIERIEFSGARVPDRNGAGIRLEAPGLTVRDCYFHDNENGILTGADATSDVVFEATEFNHNGAGDGQSHNFYVGAVRSLTVRGCYTHDAVVGHLVKSRAAANYLLYNRITGEAGTDSYEVDLPNGGLAVLVGNVIQQGAATQNPFLVSFAAEGATHADQRFYMVNNTLVNDRSSGTFVRIGGTPSVAVLTNNLFVGNGAQLSGTATSTRNLVGTAAWFVGAARFDYHLTATAGAIDMGVDPGPMPTGSAAALLPAFEYVHPRALGARTITRTIDVGAYEYGGATSLDASVADVPRDVVVEDVIAPSSDVVASDVAVAPEDVSEDTGASPPDANTGGASETGCGCSTPGTAGRVPWSMALLLALVARRRRRVTT